MTRYTAGAIKRLAIRTSRLQNLSPFQNSVVRDAIRNSEAIAARPKLAAETRMILEYALLHSRG